MVLEERIKKISEASGLGEDEIKQMIEKKKEDAAGLLTDHGAIYALEKEFGVSTEAENTPAEYTRITDLKINMNNVNLLGRVREIRPIKKFNTEKRSGQLARFSIADESGETNVVLWDKIAEIVNSDKIAVGTLLAIRNAYTKEALDKSPEVHVGNLSRIIIEPKNIPEDKVSGIPEVEESEQKIAELKENDIASTIGRILYRYPKSEFQRADGRTGQRSSMIIEDETGKLRIVMWDVNADRVDDFAEGDVVKVENGQIREGNRGLEIHIGNRGRIMASDKKIDLPEIEEAKTYKIAEIEANAQNVSVAGRVMRILPIKEFNSGDRSGKLASLIVIDETGISRIVLWGERTELIKDINQGDIIHIRNGYSKESLNGEVEVHLSSRGNLVINPPDIKIKDVADLMSKHATDKKIDDLGPDERNVGIEGLIDDVDENPIVFEICAECGSRIENVAGEWLCDICGDAKPAYGMVLSCIVGDDTGSIRTVFYRDLAEELSGIGVTDALNMIGQSGDELEPVRQIREQIQGMKIKVVGNVRYNEYQDKLEMMVSSISELSKSQNKKPESSAPKQQEVEEDVEADDYGIDDALSDDDMEIEEINLDE